MKKRSLFLFLAAGLASALLFAVSAPAEAGTLVFNDSGGSSADVQGTASGATVSSNTYGDTITSINDATVPGIPLSFNITIHSTAGVFDFADGTKTIGTGPGNEAVLTFHLDSGITFGSHLNMDGTITGVTENTLTMPLAYDFSGFAAGGLITIAIDHTGTNWNSVLNSGTKVTGAGFGLQEQVVPEPTSLALLGIGMSGFFAFRRFFKRTSVA